MASISRRMSIRWLPGKHHEPTSTLVLTTPKRFFIDIRIQQEYPYDLYWAFAGISHKSEDGQIGRWIHTIDSRYDNEVEDCGAFTQLPDGDWLERGTMLNFDTGLVGDYEEIWRDADPDPHVAAVLILGEHAHRRVMPDSVGGARGCIIRLGSWCQGVMKIDGRVTCERWYLPAGENEWKRMWKWGAGVMPCMVACMQGMGNPAEEGVPVNGRRGEEVPVEVRTRIHEGDIVQIADYKWRVAESISW